MGSDECKHQSSIDAIVFEGSIRKRRSVGGTAADHPMNAYHSGNLGIPWIHPADMRTRGSLVPYSIVLEHEVVVSFRVCSQSGIIVHGTQSKGSATSPASHHLCGQEFLGLCALSICFQILSEVGDALVQLAKNNVASVATQNCRLGNEGCISDFVRIPKYEFTGL